jgi:hypothetical protein
MKKTLRRGLLGFAVLAGMIGAFTRVQAQTVPENWQIEVDVFSGLPNPVFTLTGAELAQVKNRLSSAPTIAGASSAMASIRPAILGYRGIIVRGRSADQTQVTADAEIFHGRILRRGPSARALLDDRASGLEPLLVSLAAARQLIPAPVMSNIRQTVP